MVRVRVRVKVRVRGRVRAAHAHVAPPHGAAARAVDPRLRRVVRVRVQV